MTSKLLELPTEKLLEKIGAGNHKPGAGSAAALNAIVACQLILTVTHLTIDPDRRRKYQEYLDECNRIQLDIKERIRPKLEELFQKDSEQFDLTIKKRRERDGESNQTRKNALRLQALNELRESTELPIQIAELSIALSNYALYIFDNALIYARGDSGVALSSSLSSISGCLSIISLNLQSFPKSDWTGKIIRQRAAIRAEYELLSKELVERLNLLDFEAERKIYYFWEIQDFGKSLYGKSNISYTEIEDLARRIQNMLWINRGSIWKNNPPKTPLDVLQAKKVIDLLDYDFKEVETLGVDETNEEIAGIIDNENSVIRISRMYPSEVMNFTTAHELGHALMHDKLILHRDRPLDRPDNSYSRSIEEKHADKFAACFLMPQKPLRKRFEQLFQTKQIYLDEVTSFALGYSSVSDLRAKVKSLRGFTRLIAETKIYNGTSFGSLSDIFKVSIEAMAIRLEELDLVSLDYRQRKL